MPGGSQVTGDVVLRRSWTGRVRVRRITPEAKRLFLVDLDEMEHPFITLLPSPATSVRQAHALLKPEEMQGRTVRGRGKK